jgi:phosphohistidine phosphatase
MGHHGGVDDPAQATTHQLWILRHAQAVPEATVTRDRDRPLSARGRADAVALGTRLSDGGPVLGSTDLVLPAQALVSAAIRTVQTAGLALQDVLDRVQVATYQSLYSASPETVLAYLQEVDGDPGCVLVVAHNPTVSRLAFDLVDPEGGGRGDLLSDGLTPCSLAVIDFRVSGWSEVSDGRGALVGVFAPPY